MRLYTGRNIMAETGWKLFKKFVQSMQHHIKVDKDLSETPTSQRRPLPKSLSYYAEKYKIRNEAIVFAYATGGYTLKELGDYFKSALFYSEWNY